MPRARKDPLQPWGSITRRTTSKGRDRARVRYEAPGADGKRIRRGETVGSWQARLHLLQRRELDLLEGPLPTARRDLTPSAHLDAWLESLLGDPTGEARINFYAARSTAGLCHASAMFASTGSTRMMFEVWRERFKSEGCSPHGASVHLLTQRSIEPCGDGRGGRGEPRQWHTASPDRATRSDRLDAGTGAALPRHHE